MYIEYSFVLGHIIGAEFLQFLVVFCAIFVPVSHTFQEFNVMIFYIYADDIFSSLPVLRV